MRMSLLVVIFTILCSFLAYGEEVEIQRGLLPSALMYDEKQIPEEVLKDFFGPAVIGYLMAPRELDIPKALDRPLMDQQEESDDGETYYTPEISFEWEYIGTLHNDFHLVYVYWWESGCMGKFTGVLILRREENLLKITDVVWGGERHSSAIYGPYEIDEDSVRYNQCATTEMIVYEALKMHPDLEELYDSSSKSRLCGGEAGYAGTFDYVARISSEGKVLGIKLIGFTPCEGEHRDAELYQQGGLKALAVDLLTDIP